MRLQTSSNRKSAIVLAAIFGGSAFANAHGEVAYVFPFLGGHLFAMFFVTAFLLFWPEKGSLRFVTFIAALFSIIPVALLLGLIPEKLYLKEGRLFIVGAAGSISIFLFSFFNARWHRKKQGNSDSHDAKPNRQL